MSAETLPERRPLKTRSRAWAQFVADWLARTGIEPNTISLLGLGAGILSGVCLAATRLVPELAWLGWLLGAGFTQLRLLANMLDGISGG